MLLLLLLLLLLLGIFFSSFSFGSTALSTSRRSEEVVFLNHLFLDLLVPVFVLFDEQSVPVAFERGFHVASFSSHPAWRRLRHLSLPSSFYRPSLRRRRRF